MAKKLSKTKPIKTPVDKKLLKEALNSKYNYDWNTQPSKGTDKPLLNTSSFENTAYPVMSGFFTQALRNATPLALLPQNTKQLIAANITGDTKYGIIDAPKDQQQALFNSIEDAHKNNSKSQGTQYKNYGELINKDLQHLKGNVAGMIGGSLLSPDFNAATTFGRVSYKYNPETDTYNVYDSYDFSKTPNTNTNYAKVRNAVGDLAEKTGISSANEKSNLIGSFKRSEWLNNAKPELSYEKTKNLTQMGINKAKKLANTAGIQQFGDGGKLGYSWSSSPSTSQPKINRPLTNNEKDLLKLGVQLIDPTGISNYPDVYNDIKNKNYSDLPFDLLGSVPLVGKISKVAKGIKIGRAKVPLELMIKTVGNASDIGNISDDMQKNNKIPKHKFGDIIKDAGAFAFGAGSGVASGLTFGLSNMVTDPLGKTLMASDGKVTNAEKTLMNLGNTAGNIGSMFINPAGGSASSIGKKLLAGAIKGSVEDTNNGRPIPTFGGGGQLSAWNPLAASKDSLFQKWYSTNTLEGRNKIPFSDKLNYDYYSYYKNGEQGGSPEAHFTDRYKRPTHPTFSNESIYSTPENPGGHWTGDTYHKRGKYDNGEIPTFPFGGMTNMQPAEVEKKENVLMPNGQGHQFNGPSHEAGGINTILPEGTMVFTDTLKTPEGKTFADANKPFLSNIKNSGINAAKYIGQDKKWSENSKKAAQANSSKLFNQQEVMKNEKLMKAVSRAYKKYGGKMYGPGGQVGQEITKGTLENAGNLMYLFNEGKGYDTVKYNPLTPTYLNPNEAINDIKGQSSIAKYNISNVANGNSGNYLSNVIGLNNATNKSLAMTRENYDNQNVGIGNQFKQFNEQNRQVAEEKTAMNKDTALSKYYETLSKTGGNASNRWSTAELSNNQYKQDSDLLQVYKKLYPYLFNK